MALKVDAGRTSSDPRGLHDWESREYVDAWIADDVTEDDQRRPFLRRVVEDLPVDRDRPIRVLDVGGGYGVLSREVLDALPRAEVVLQDLSEAMLSHARERLADAGGRITFVQADFRDPGWPAAVGGPFDAVVSSLAIHNVRQPDLIRQVYLAIGGVVAPGGCFVNIDNMAPADVPVQLEWFREAGFARVECLHQDRFRMVLAGYR